MNNVLTTAAPRQVELNLAQLFWFFMIITNTFIFKAVFTLTLFTIFHVVIVICQFLEIFHLP